MFKIDNENKKDISIESNCVEADQTYNLYYSTEEQPVFNEQSYLHMLCNYDDNDDNSINNIEDNNIELLNDVDMVDENIEEEVIFDKNSLEEFEILEDEFNINVDENKTDNILIDTLEENDMFIFEEEPNTIANNFVEDEILELNDNLEIENYEDEKEFLISDNLFYSVEEQPIFNEVSFNENLGNDFIKEELQSDKYRKNLNNKKELEVFENNQVIFDESSNEEIVVLEKNDNSDLDYIIEKPSNNLENAINNLFNEENNVPVINVDKDIELLLDDIKINKPINNDRIEFHDVVDNISIEYLNNTNNNEFDNIKIIETNEEVKSIDYSNYVLDSYVQPNFNNIDLSNIKTIMPGELPHNYRNNLTNNFAPKNDYMIYSNKYLEKSYIGNEIISKTEGLPTIDEQIKKIKKPNLFRKYTVASTANLAILKSIDRLLDLTNSVIARNQLKK